MTRWQKAFAALAVLILIAAFAVQYLFGSEAVPANASYRIDVPALRGLATSRPGALPVEIRSELLAETRIPRGAMMAGEPFEPQAMVHTVFQLVYPDGRTILLDSGMSEEQAAQMGRGFPVEVNEPAFQKVREALGSAWQIVVTHEHTDHIGGLATYAELAGIAGRVRLSAEQLASTQLLDAAGMPLEVRARFEPLVFDELAAIAPGVVLQKAPGHTPGSLMVFVALADGREFLFIGDIAWNRDALTQLAYRPRLVTDFMLGENRSQVLAQFRALHDLMRARESAPANGPQVVVSHDPRDREAYGLGKGF